MGGASSQAGQLWPGSRDVPSAKVLKEINVGEVGGGRARAGSAGDGESGTEEQGGCRGRRLAKAPEAVAEGRD
eukprot:13708225-Heterocapsa_arctica.AAC.1